MKATFIAAINQICSEKNVSPEQVLEAVKQAIATAYRKDFGNREQEIRVELNEGNDEPTILLIKEIVDDVDNENFEISLADAKKIKSESEVGDEIEIDVTPEGYGRIAAQSAKQVILQKLQEAEKQSLYEMFKDREEELLTATVTKVEPNWITLEIEGMAVSLPWKEQIPGEHYYTGKRIRVYLDKVELTGKGPQLRISRTNSGLVRKLLELEIPEVRNGDVDIKSIARDPGFRSKVAVQSDDARIDPIGACVGQKGVRIQAVMEELNGERVDMIEWSDDPIKLISTALQPAAISAVIIINNEERIDDEGRRIKKRAAVFVEEAQRPMAIGKKGQNIRLATDLTSFELDMYNYEELPAFKAKLAELQGGAEIIVQELNTEPEEEEAKEAKIGKQLKKEEPKEEDPKPTEEKEEVTEEASAEPAVEEEAKKAPAEEPVVKEEVKEEAEEASDETPEVPEVTEEKEEKA
ncbi:transcription termination/antitermination protein NusA [Candidatus Peregrinibacteria bacterium]|jgi:transcription termination/antitermination protein NusA|nr:transcription termination/antitermination protein NusA [Candidatus Peregrinibacteria bacterium]MBT3598250.1 transcription termination/antitermination protein NusA [Candidatus Peregrinibacteria bacterium]MBT4366774.1 transcription termination/antitermination protein NusA [Candidatus Peregrinibacteria bacterium]MBT4585571.1 transcription termination/antitermination protein NusA [Candidatus Peregrinibacteria bacterium]MBT6730999.1 transcription termination/antitermination protein NusA [Candidat